MANCFLKILVKPRLGKRRCSGIWPPSKPRFWPKPVPARWPLAAARGGLARARAHAAADALARLFCPAVVDVSKICSGFISATKARFYWPRHRYSTTFNRCGTFFTMPRNTGESGRTTI